MPHRVTSQRLAQCLSIIAEASPDDFVYSSAVDALRDIPWKSNSMRWTIASAPSFDPKEFHFLLSVASRAGLVEADDDNHLKLAAGHMSLEPWKLRLTVAGWKFLEDFDTTTLGQWGNNIVNNVPSIIISVATALIVSSLLGQ